MLLQGGYQELILLLMGVGLAARVTREGGYKLLKREATQYLKRRLRETKKEATSYFKKKLRVS